MANALQVDLSCISVDTCTFGKCFYKNVFKINKMSTDIPCMPGTHGSKGERYVRSNREAVERDLDFIIMMMTIGLFKKEIDRT